ncbi:hypothetical protein TCAL_16486 [Tigriopus californicus]|uniref:Uncharacterized protein n=1 Tax=Tigriopus californicus TaxID=6832 RepID=A0A553NUE8_TIGCA|nr:hypothetical protein TCAL_16486 [Tigriopus californicus]
MKNSATEELGTRAGMAGGGEMRTGADGAGCKVGASVFGARGSKSASSVSSESELPAKARGLKSSSWRSSNENPSNLLLAESKLMSSSFSGFLAEWLESLSLPPPLLKDPFRDVESFSLILTSQISVI